jgi:Tol biopolymer transport system component
VDSSRTRVLVPWVNSWPVWSPTGDRIAFLVGTKRTFSGEIRIVDVASGKVTSVVKDGTDDLDVIGFS